MIRVKTAPAFRPVVLNVKPQQAVVSVRPRRITTRPVTIRQPATATRIAVRAPRVAPSRMAASPMFGDATPEVRINPYVEFSGRFTVAGGIEITYRDLDTRFLRKFLHFLLWATCTAATGWWLFERSQFTPVWQWGLFAAVAITLGYLLSRPKEIARTIEIRADCMILDGADVFWLDRMELGWPQFLPDQDNNLVLQGVYGTRFVEFFTVRRFDERDRGPEVLQAHLQGAMRQLWAFPNRDT
ncbi:hypothetical protein HNR60_003315 [Rhodopseudomonas rhenobacensis]|uniref:Uncharacterized protein n=1 Tax=Rhodopseudomonas rhenobacensis TaxID=87461 RepID=A0A7W7Z5T4_9BRAD|nr:hypothetical protein [Rhodopseudomonas rhenobacensis]MBB5048548.1 hypothetical protein [Rhodopseudomonas rhenobacensis]